MATTLVASCSIHEKDFERMFQDDVEFYASFEQPDEDGTKVYANEGLLLRWTADDRVTIFNKNTYNQQYKFCGETGDNAGGFSKVQSDEFITGNTITNTVSVYPYQKTTKISDNGVITVSLPAEQTFADITFGLGANTMVSVSEDNFLQYKNVGGYLMLKLYGERVSVSSVTLKGNNGEKLAGDASVTMPLGGVPSVTMAEDATTEITLTCPEPVTLGKTAEESTQFWFVIPPVTFSKGFTVSIGETTGGYYEKSTTKSITILRNNLSRMSSIEVEIITPTMPVPEAVDLGLSVKWASFNLGASKPEEVGDYFAWGEIEPYYSGLDPLTWKEGKEEGYRWPSYRWCNGSEDTLTKYNLDDSQGLVDNKTVLEKEDDAADVNLSGKWRMPTNEELTELIENCTWTWTTQNGVKGYNVTAINNNSIFLPVTGYRLDCQVLSVDSGYYWSSSLNPNTPLNARGLSFSSKGVYGIQWSRYIGQTIRPVFHDRIHPESITLDKTSLSLYVGKSELLTAAVSPTNVTDKSVSWSSSNNSVAMVSAKGAVTGLAAGSAVITATTLDGEKFATCEVSVVFPMPEAVDLGLSVKWASFNLGATEPEEYGEYYAWGETEPYYIRGWNSLIWKPGKESGYCWESYKWCMGSDNTLTKYCEKSSFGYNGFTDDKAVLELEDDAAHVNLGGNWRMPTAAEMNELREKCTRTWTTQNGKKGYMMTGQNGNSIFLPAAGEWSHTSYTNSDRGYYLSSSLYESNSNTAKDFFFDSGVFASNSKYSRYYGHSIRPVYADPIHPESVFLNKSSLPLHIGYSEQLTAAVFPANATDKTVSWSSSNPSVAEVSSSGVVVGVAIGTAVITVTTADGGKKATCNVTVTEATVPLLEAVDLGLSVKWASINLGAIRPEDYGDYYAWGETEPYYSNLDPLTWKEGKEAGYDWSSYKWCMGDGHTITKYCYELYGYNGFYDFKSVLDPEDDAAHVNLGGNWRMPTKEEWSELRENCTWTMITRNGVNGRLVTARNGNSIFLPAAGGLCLTDLDGMGCGGIYWTSSLNRLCSNDAMLIEFFSDGVGLFDNVRCAGNSIRPVCAE